MKRFGVLLPLVLALCSQCCPSGPTQPTPQWQDTTSKVVGALVDRYFGAPISQIPNTQTDPCSSAPTPGLFDEDALKTGSGACAQDDADDECTRCAKGYCCREALTCFADETSCNCRLAVRTAGRLPEIDRCGANDAAYMGIDACLSAHCAVCTP